MLKLRNRIAKAARGQLRAPLAATADGHEVAVAGRGRSVCSAIFRVRENSRPMARLARVAVTGGTHGNEPNGVELARHLQRHPELAARGSFDTTVLITNPAAVAKSVRYVEEDLNRCFLKKDLADDGRSSLEAVRARELNAILGPKGTVDAMDYIIDLHNTTANTGVALMISPTDELSHGLAAYLIALDSDVRVCNWAKGASDYALLPTLGKHGMTFEVGPCPTGCVIGESYARSLTLIGAALDYLHAYNLSISPAPGVAPPSHVDDRVCVYVFVAKVRPPRLTSREWCHVSHPRLRPLPSRHVVRHLCAGALPARREWRPRRDDPPAPRRLRLHTADTWRPDLPDARSSAGARRPSSWPRAR